MAGGDLGPLNLLWLPLVAEASSPPPGEGSGFHLEMAEASLLAFLDVWHSERGNRVGLNPTL